MKGFAANLAERPDHPALVQDGRSLTYGELHQRASRLAAGLAARGVDRGPLAVMLPNGIPFLEAMAASAKLAVPVVNLNWHLRPDEAAWILEDSGAEALVADDRLRSQVEAVAGEHAVPVVWFRDGEPDLPDTGGDDLPYRWPCPWPVLYTSGTSGRPKGVEHQAQADPDLMAMTQDMLAELWGYQADDVHVAAGPMYHAGPWGYANSTLYVGGTVVLIERWDAAAFLAAVERERVTTTFLTPAHMIRLLELPDADRARVDASSLRHVIHAGAPCPVPVKQRFVEAFPQTEVWELYGASEGGATRVSSDEWRERPGTVGLPWPGTEIRILDPDTGEPRPTGEDGVVWIAPARGGFRYRNDPEKTEAAWRDGAFTVGDIGHLDADGYLFLTDRLSDMLIRAGVNIYPREIEDALHGHPEVVDCAVFGVPHERDGEHPTAVVEVRGGTTVDDLRTWLAERIDPYKVPTQIDLVDELPRDPNGKVLKRLLRERAWADAGPSI